MKDQQDMNTEADKRTISGDADLARRKLLKQLTWGLPAIVATASVSARAASQSGDPCNQVPRPRECG